MKREILFCLVLLSFVLYGKSGDNKEVQIKKVDGINHISNPKKPLKGTVTIKIEKALEIDPYRHEEVGLRYILFVRDEQGNVILFDPTRAEAQRFSSRGDYLGSLVRKGQGPGEFSEIQVCFMNNEIWAWSRSGMKMARFDGSGRFLSEKKLRHRPDIFINENCFFAADMQQKKEGPFEKVSLVSMSSKEEEISIIDFFQAENAGMIRTKRGGFADQWGTPDIRFAYDRKNQKFYAALNTQYKVFVKNLKGEMLYVIEKPYKNVRVGLKEKRKLLSFFPKTPSSDEVFSAYPDHLVAIKEIKILPRGYLAVYRVSGPGSYEIDVFNPEGKYFYAIKESEGISLERAIFHESGFATVLEKEGQWLYVDYKIKNLAEIFQD